MTRHAWLRAAAEVASFGAIYLVLDVALNVFAFSDGWTIVWPLNGVTVAMMLMRPRSAWPAMLLGVELGTAIGEYLDGNALALEIGQRVCSVTEVLLSAALLPPFKTLESWLHTPRLYARFLASMALGPGISGVMAAAMFHVFAGESYVEAFNRWATPDILGNAATMPLILSLRSPQMKSLFQLPALTKTVGVLTLALCAAALIFWVSQYPLLFLLYPVLLLVDSNLGFAGSAIALLGVTLISIYLTTNGHGPFGQWPASSPIARDLAFQIYFGFHLIALLPASVMLIGRRRWAEELRGSNARLTVLASLDSLTGIANRRSFDDRLAEEWKRAVGLRTPIGLVMIDLDHFKQYNDRYGHPAGDRCLRRVGEALTASCRYPDGLVARTGGEEFAVLLPGCGAVETQGISERFRIAISELAIEHAGNPWFRVTVSIGFAAVKPTPADRETELWQLADAALYQAKRLGRNRVECISSAEGLEAAREQVGVSSKIRLLRLIGRGTG